MEGSYSTKEKSCFNVAVKSAYENIDSILRNYAYRNPFPTELRAILEFIWKFEKEGSKSFIFTLNQDLFFERLYYGPRPSIPGIENNSKWFKSTFRDTLTILDDYCQLPDENELIRIKPHILSDENFFIIKLHGSYNWLSFKGPQQMVIGRGKTELIQKEPLLKYYFEIFKKALFQPQRSLLIIGYSFRDDHINRIIGEAVKDHGLEIYVVLPKSPSDFKDDLIEIPKSFNDYIWQGLSGYYSYKLNDIFRIDGQMTLASKDLYENFFRTITLS